MVVQHKNYHLKTSISNRRSKNEADIELSGRRREQQGGAALESRRTREQQGGAHMLATAGARGRPRISTGGARPAPEEGLGRRGMRRQKLVAGDAAATGGADDSSGGEVCWVADAGASSVRRHPGLPRNASSVWVVRWKVFHLLELILEMSYYIVDSLETVLDRKNW